MASTRREAIIAFLTWLVAMAWSIGYCATHAYRQKADDLRFIWGFPDWVLWGVVVPWGACLIFSWMFAAVFMRDADLGEDATSGDGSDEIQREP